MNFELLRGQKVVIVRKIRHKYSNVTDNKIGKTYVVYDIKTDGRSHSKYIAYLTLKGSNGEHINATMNEIEICNPNAEPECRCITCTACGATFTETELIKPIKELDRKACPYCRTLDCDNEENL